MRAPLAVRLRDGLTDRHVTQYVEGLRFRKTAPGGHADASMTVTLPAETYPDLGPADRLYLYGPAGQVVWEGYTNNPGTKTGSSGEGFDLSALGGQALASDRADAMVYRDTQLTSWKRGGNVNILPSSTTEVSASPDTGNSALVLKFNPGQPVQSADFTQMVYDMAPLGCRVGGYGSTFHAGRTDATYRYRYIIGSSAILDVFTGLSTATVTSSRRSIINYTAGPTAAYVILQRNGAATNVSTTADDCWVALENVAVLGQLVDRNGTDISSPSMDWIRASDVVEDLLGRVLTFCNPVTSSVTATTFQIDQLAYLNAATAAQILDDLSLYEPDMLWEVLESNANGLHRFNYRAWPTTARYVIPPSVEVEQPGGEVDLCNRITVSWTDSRGNPQVTVRTSTVPELGTRVRDAQQVTLPEGFGSLANAQRIGDQILATKSSPPRAATATIDQAIVDRDRGCLVQPWEIEPGYLAQIMATGASMRITEMEYTDESGEAKLTLGDPVLTNDQRLARLAKVR